MPQFTDSPFFVDSPQSEVLTTVNQTQNSSLGNETLKHVEKYNTDPEAYAMPVLFAIIFLVGLLGNGALIFTVLRNKKMRNVPNIFILSLACGDFLLLLVSVPFTATIYTINYWPYGQFMCKLNSFLQYFSLGVSVFTLTALSGDRYTAIVNPMKKHKSNAIIKTSCIAVAIWGLAFVLAIPKAVTSNVQYQKAASGRFAYCYPYPKLDPYAYSRADVSVSFVVYFALPMSIIAAFYILMARILVHSYQHMPGEQKGQGHKQFEARKKVAQIVLSFVVFFIICWLPRHIYLIWAHLLPGDYNWFWHVFKMVSFCLTYINSCLNPLALYFLSRQFRRYYKQYLCCCCFCCDKRGRPSETEESQCGTMYKFHNTPGNKRPSSTAMTMATSQTVC